MRTLHFHHQEKKNAKNVNKQRTKQTSKSPEKPKKASLGPAMAPKRDSECTREVADKWQTGAPFFRARVCHMSATSGSPFWRPRTPNWSQRTPKGRPNCAMGPEKATANKKQKKKQGTFPNDKLLALSATRGRKSASDGTLGLRIGTQVYMFLYSKHMPTDPKKTSKKTPQGPQETRVT